jgi:hypothetical protein
MLHGDEQRVGLLLQHASVKTTQDHYQNRRVRARQERAFATYIRAVSEMRRVCTIIVRGTTAL